MAHSHFWGGPVKKSKIHKTSKAVLTKCLPDKTSADLFFIGWSTSRHFPSYSRICISACPHVLMEDNALHILLAVYKTVFFFIFGRFPCTAVRIMHVGAPLCGFGERHRCHIVCWLCHSCAISNHSPTLRPCSHVVFYAKAAISYFVNDLYIIITYTCMII